MDTTVPRGVKQKRYIFLKYDNREKARQFLEDNEEYDHMLLDKVSLHYFLGLPDETKRELLAPYMED